MTWAKAIELALRTSRGEGPMVAMCPVCVDEVLVGSLRLPGFEFWCLSCERGYGYVEPRGAEETPELLERIRINDERFAELFDG